VHPRFEAETNTNRPRPSARNHRGVTLRLFNGFLAKGRDLSVIGTPSHVFYSGELRVADRHRHGASPARRERWELGNEFLTFRRPIYFSHSFYLLNGPNGSARPDRGFSEFYRK
jgi:hypothetical protein